MEKVVNFQGNCIYKVNTNYTLSKKEKKYFSSLNYNSGDNLLYISSNSDILNNVLCNNLKNMLDSYANYYLKNLLEINHGLKLLNSWVTINKKGSSHHFHIHPNTFFSLCFYPQIDSGGITFQQEPLISSKTNLFFNQIKPNTFNSRSLTLNISPKDLIIFPGWLNHRGETNNTTTDRIMIGANYFISGNLGKDYKVNQLQLL